MLGLLESGGLPEAAPTSDDGTAETELENLLAEREKARAAKDWARSDEIRDLLKAKGITIKDTPQGVQIIRE